MKDLNEASLRLQELRRLQRQDSKRRLDNSLRKAILVATTTAYPDIMFPCPDCNATLLVTAEYTGFEAHCCCCGHRIEIPEAENPLFGAEHSGREVQDRAILEQFQPRALEARYLSAVMDREISEAEDVRVSGQDEFGDRGKGSGRRSEHNVVLSIVVNKDGELITTPGPTGGSITNGAEGDLIDPKTRERRRPGQRAIKTPVKSTLELAITSDGGREASPSLTVWQAQSEQREWERLVVYGLLGVLILVITAVSVIVLLNTNKKAPEPPGTAVPAQTLGSNAVQELPIASVAPADLEEAKWVIKHYMTAPTWRDRLPFVRMPERVAPLMEEYYKTNPDAVINHTSMEMTWAGYVRGHFLIVVTVADTNYREHYFTLERVGDEYKIDWEVLVEYNPMSWKEFRERRPTEPVTFRVSLTSDQYYNFQFADATRYQCFRIASREEFVGMYGYAQRSAPWFSNIDISPGFTKLVMLKLKFPEETEGSNQVEIVDYVQQSWVVFPEDLTDGPPPPDEGINTPGAPGTAVKASEGDGKTKFTERPSGPILSNSKGPSPTGLGTPTSPEPSSPAPAPNSVAPETPVPTP